MSTIIGRKIRELRLEQNKTLKDLSEGTDLSISYLSKIEREDFTISVPVLEKISSALGVTTQFFLEGPTIIRSFDHETDYIEEEMISVERVSVNPEKREMAATIVDVLPNNVVRATKPHSHNGEEFVYVLEGTLTVILDDSRIDLFPGDSLHFSSEHTHLWHNRTNKVVRFLDVTTYPGNWVYYLTNVAPLLDPTEAQ